MDCLWIAGDVPHPPTYGKLVYSAGLSEALAGAGVDVVGVGLVPAEGGTRFESAVEWHAVAAARRSRAASVLSPLPSMAFGTTALRNAVLAQFSRRRWDAVVVDHLETGWVVRDVPRPGPPIVHIAHNHETSVREAIAQESSRRRPRGVALRLEAAKTARLERTVLAHSDLVVAITDGDAAQFARDAPDVPRVVLTPGYAGAGVAARTIDASVPRQVVMVTSLDWHVKQANLEAFVAVADPVFAAAGIQLAVAGDAPPELARRIGATARATVLLGRVDALERLLARARIGIVAEPLGGGFKLKVLDFVNHRVPIVATTGSVEGTSLRPGRDLLEYPDAASLARAVVDLVDDFPRLDALQASAFDRAAGAFSWPERGRRLADALAGPNLTPRPETTT